MGVPVRDWAAAMRGIVTPAARYDCWVSDEQSHSIDGRPECESAQLPPNEYGVPIWASAQLIAVTIGAGVAGGSAKPAGRFTGPASSARSPPSSAHVSDAATGLIVELPATSAPTSWVASGSHFAYASGNALRCTACAATVSGICDQPETVSSFW